jgi:ribosomal protein S18 acetylase RimI-like enzyme
VGKASKKVIGMKKIEYVEKDKKDLDIIGPLWEKLREHHKVRSQHFQKHFKQFTWEIRKNELLEKCHNGSLLVHLAKDKNTNKCVGYCVSTINENKVGEIESIFIEADYRRMGIGDTFMKRAMKWMDGKSATRRVIAVAAGNEEAFGFYAKYKFYPRASILTQAD